LTIQIALVLSILVLAIILFVSERVRVDIVGLLVMISLVLTGLLAPEEAISGFSSPAVITVWGVFILSAGLSRTGVAGLIGRQILKLAGRGELQLMTIIMITAGGMSAFMNNVGVAALLLPVVMDITRRIGIPPSRLLMPLATGCLLGGLTTMIGTPPNIIVSNSLRDYGLISFSLFDYTPVGLVVLFSGVIFMVFLGRHLLPNRNLAQEYSQGKQIDLDKIYQLSGQMFFIRVPEGASLAGETLAESRIGTILGVNILGIMRDGETNLSPEPNSIINSGDRLLATGTAETLEKYHEHGYFEIEDDHLPVERLVSKEVELAELSIAPDSKLFGMTLQEINFRKQFGVNVVAIWKKGEIFRTNLQKLPLDRGDILVIQGSKQKIEDLKDEKQFLTSAVDDAEVSQLHERLIMIKIPPDSNLVDKTLEESRLGDAFGLNVLGIVREGTTHLIPKPTDKLQANDALLVEGRMEDQRSIRGLQDLEVEERSSISLKDLQTERVGMIEAVLSPHTNLAGKTLREIHFREKYGLSVLAIWREGRVHRLNLQDMQLRFGDALLLFGNREKIKLLGSEPDFLVLMEEAEEVPRVEKAPVAAIIMGLVLLPVILGLLPIFIAAVLGSTLMVLTKCLTMDEAYRYIEWKAVFLIAGMLPMGIAMEKTGAASFIANNMILIIGDLHPTAGIVGIFLLTAMAAQVMPTAAVAVLMASIALNTATVLQVSPYALMMTVAMAASASFMSPVAHPANLLIMGPGGYRFSDYIKVGFPLTLVVLAVVTIVVPIFWPLIP
jgi:di/tricarboxylate transporter